MTTSNSSAVPGAISNSVLDALLICARTDLSPSQAERLCMIVHGDLDWPNLLARASFHKLLPLLFWHLSKTCPAAVPTSWMDFLRTNFERNVRNSLFHVSELLRILWRFEVDGVLAIPYKGPTLALAAYQNLAFRDFEDLDVLAPQRDIAKAAASLSILGYRPLFDLDASEPASRGRYHGQYSFSSHDGKVLLELHSEETLRYFPKRLDFSLLADRLESIQVGGQRIPSLSPEHLLILLCVHGAKDFWGHIAWICDIAELVRSRPDMDWNRVSADATSLGTERMLRVGLFLARDLLDANVPAEWVRKCQSDSETKRLARFVRDRISKPFEPDFLERFFFRLRMPGGLLAGSRYCLRLATTPSDLDSTLVKLPGPPSFFSRLLRPFDLMKMHGLRVLRRTPERDLGSFTPTPLVVAERMLDLAQVGPGDVVYDLGCGDGRIVIAAAKNHDARGVGIDIDPRRIAEARANARKEGVEGKVRFIQQDAKTVDLSPATVVTLYLTMGGHIRLRQKLLRELRPGTRLVARGHDMGDWPPTQEEMVLTPKGGATVLHLWRIGDARPLLSEVTDPAATPGQAGKGA